MCDVVMTRFRPKLISETRWRKFFRSDFLTWSRPDHRGISTNGSCKVSRLLHLSAFNLPNEAFPKAGIGRLIHVGVWILGRIAFMWRRTVESKMTSSSGGACHSAFHPESSNGLKSESLDKGSVRNSALLISNSDVSWSFGEGGALDWRRGKGSECSAWSFNNSIVVIGGSFSSSFSRSFIDQKRRTCHEARPRSRLCIESTTWYSITFQYFNSISTE